MFLDSLNVFFIFNFNYIIFLFAILGTILALNVKKIPFTKRAENRIFYI